MSNFKPEAQRMKLPYILIYLANIGGIILIIGAIVNERKLLELMSDKTLIIDIAFPTLPNLVIGIAVLTIFASIAGCVGGFFGNILMLVLSASALGILTILQLFLAVLTLRKDEESLQHTMLKVFHMSYQKQLFQLCPDDAKGRCWDEFKADVNACFVAAGGCLVGSGCFSFGAAASQIYLNKLLDRKPLITTNK